MRSRKTYKDKFVKLYLFLFCIFVTANMCSLMMIFINKLIFIPITIILSFISIFICIILFRYISDYHYFLNKKKKKEIIDNCSKYSNNKHIIKTLIDTYKVSGRVDYKAYDAIINFYANSPEDNMVAYLMGNMYYYSSFDKYAFLSNKFQLMSLRERMMINSIDKTKEILDYYLTNSLDECINTIYNASFEETGLYKYETELYNNVIYLADLISKEEHGKYYDKSYIYDKYKHKRCIIESRNDKYIIKREKFFNGWYEESNNKEYLSKDEALKAVNNYFKK